MISKHNFLDRSLLSLPISIFSRPLAGATMFVPPAAAPLHAPMPSPCMPLLPLPAVGCPSAYRVVALVQWSRPHPGWYKLNFDGSVHHDGSGRASTGGVIRDSYGRVVLAFAKRTPHAGVGVVEARALIRGLRFALVSGYDRLVVEGDDLTLVLLLRGKSKHTRIPSAMHAEIRRLLSCFREYEVQHVYREGNQVADTLCHQAYRCPGVWKMDQLPPPAVWAKAEDDRHGVVYPRLRAAATGRLDQGQGRPSRRRIPATPASTNMMMTPVSRRSEWVPHFMQC